MRFKSEIMLLNIIPHETKMTSETARAEQNRFAARLERFLWIEGEITGEGNKEDCSPHGEGCPGGEYGGGGGSVVDTKL